MRRPRQDAAATRSRSRSAVRLLWLGVSLAVVVGLQLASTWGRLDGPFLDTRLHYHYDNADFGFKIRSGLRNEDLRSQLGVTMNAYSAWGERKEPPRYYTDHPFLLKTLLQLYARLAGVSEWTTRSFSLLVAVATVVGLYTLVLMTTRSLWAAAAGAATLATLPLFAVYQVCVKFEADGMLLAVWLFVAYMAVLRRGTPAMRWLYAVLVVVAFLTHWTAMLFVGCLAVYQLLLGRRLVRARELAGTTLWAAAAGLIALMAVMSYLQNGWLRAMEVLMRAFVIRSALSPLSSWAARQLSYLEMNFTVPVGLACLAMAGLLAWRLRRAKLASASTRESPDPEGVNQLAAFIAVSSAVACIWVAGFRQGSFIHSYWQYWFCFPIAALVASTLALAGTGRARWVLRCLACGLVIWLFVAGQRAHGRVVADQLGTRDEIEFLRSLRADSFDRLVFVPVTATALNQWFQGPLFLYYTDRPVSVAHEPHDVRAGDKLLVLRFRERDQVTNRLEQWSSTRLANEKCGRRICAYDVRED